MSCIGNGCCWRAPGEGLHGCRATRRKVYLDEREVENKEKK